MARPSDEYDSYIAPNGYVYVKLPGHPNADDRGYVAEHRLIMSQELGRPLERKEVVHHKNDVRTDNRRENLEVLTIAEHMVRHRGEDSELRLPDEPNPEIECACGCGETLRKYDQHNRPREYIVGHQGHLQKAPTQSEIVALLAEEGPLKRITIINRTGRTVSAIQSALAELEKKGKARKCEGHGIWGLTDSAGVKEVTQADD